MTDQTSFSVFFSRKQTGSANELIASRDFHFGIDRFADFHKTAPSPLLTDLLRIAVAIYVVDRLVRREQRITSFRWERSLKLQIGVSEPGFWSNSEVRTALTECIDFVSGDDWDLAFALDECEQAVSGKRFLEFSDPFAGNPPLICLYSGGLDSVAGLSRRMTDCPGRPVVPVTFRHQAAQGDLIGKQFRTLKNRYGVQPAPLVVKASLIWSAEMKKWERKQERSQRTRSFLFTAAGAVVAAMSGATAIEVYESGIGAINLPLTAWMLGSRATKSCHPEFLRRMSRLVSLVAGREIAFHLPFLSKTKGQIVRHLANEGLGDLALSTASCVHYPLRENPHKQCGVCPACILRRQALRVAGIGEHEGTYKHDLFGSAATVNQIPADTLQYLKAFLMQVVHLGDLEMGDRLPGRISRHLYGTRVIQRDESPLWIVELLLRYRREWLEIVEEGQRQDWAWARLVAATQSIPEKGMSHASA